MEFEPNYLQRQYIGILENAFNEGVKNQDDKYLSTIISCLDKIGPTGKCPNLFYEFWFDKLLTENSQIFLNFLNPNFDKFFDIDIKQKALYVERYLKVLGDNQQFSELKNLLDKSLEFKMILDPNFIKKLPVDSVHFTETNKKMSEKIATKNNKDFFEKNIQKSLTEKNSYK